LSPKGADGKPSSAWLAELESKGFIVLKDTFATAMGRLCISKDHPELQALHLPKMNTAGKSYINFFPYIDIYSHVRAQSTPESMITSAQANKPAKGRGPPYKCKDVDGCTIVHESEFLPLKNCRIRGKQFPCPAKPHEVLTRSYGTGWPIPVAENPTDNAGEGMKFSGGVQKRQAATDMHKWHATDIKLPPVNELDCVMHHKEVGKECSMPCLRGVTKEESYSLQLSQHPAKFQFSKQCPQAKKVEASCGPEECPGEPMEAATVEAEFQTKQPLPQIPGATLRGMKKGYLPTDRLVSKGRLVEGEEVPPVLTADYSDSQRMVLNITHPHPQAKITFKVYQMSESENDKQLKRPKTSWECQHPLKGFLPTYATKELRRHIYISVCVLLPIKDGEKQRGSWSLTTITLSRRHPRPILLLKNGTTCPMRPAELTGPELMLDALVARGKHPHQHELRELQELQHPLLPYMDT